MNYEFLCQPPQHPIKGDSIVVIVKTDFNVKSKVSGFLNVFKNTWHRRWFSQTGYFLNSWLYPEDHEDGKVRLKSIKINVIIDLSLSIFNIQLSHTCVLVQPLIESIYLPACTEKVKPADMELCIRPHSFVITLGSQKQILFSADSNKDMMKWINHLNLIIEHIQLWKPNV